MNFQLKTFLVVALATVWLTPVHTGPWSFFFGKPSAEEQQENKTVEMLRNYPSMPENEKRKIQTEINQDTISKQIMLYSQRAGNRNGNEKILGNLIGMGCITYPLLTFGNYIYAKLRGKKTTAWSKAKIATISGLSLLSLVSFVWPHYRDYKIESDGHQISAAYNQLFPEAK